MFTTKLHRHQEVSYPSLRKDASGQYPDNKIALDYFLYEHTFEDTPIYSVAVNKSENGVSEEKLAESVTSDPVRAEVILDALADGCVTPCCLLEIMEELLP